MKKKFVVSFAIFIFFLGNIAGVFAASKLKEVKAYFNPSIKVELNGQEAKDIKGLTYNGELYLPAKTISDYFGLNAKFVYDNKNNKLIIGGPKYLNFYNGESKNFYQLIINGNWGPSIITDERQLYSNYYMGVDVSLKTIENVSLNDYYSDALKNEFKYLKIHKNTSTEIANSEAIVADYQTSDSVGKLVIIHRDSDFLSILFFVDKTRFKDSDYKEFEKIIKTLNIQ